MRIEYESNEIPLMRPIYEDEEEFELTLADMQAQLMEIAGDLGYQYIEQSESKLGKGTISITNDVTIVIRYNEEKVTYIYVGIGEARGDKFQTALYDCTTNASEIDSVSVALQTASMIISEIRRKLV